VRSAAFDARCRRPDHVRRRGFRNSSRSACAERGAAASTSAPRARVKPSGDALRNPPPPDGIHMSSALPGDCTAALRARGSVRPGRADGVTLLVRSCPSAAVFETLCPRAERLGAGNYAGPCWGLLAAAGHRPKPSTSGCRRSPTGRHQSARRLEGELIVPVGNRSPTFP
jgi:hypothetical protein